MKGYQKIGKLIYLHIRKEIKFAQNRELQAWRDLSDSNEKFFKQETSLAHIRERLLAHEESKIRIWKKLEAQYPPNWKDGPQPKPALVIRMLKYAAIFIGGIILLTLAVVGVGLFWESRSPGKNAMIITVNGERKIMSDGQLGLWAGLHGIHVEKKGGGDLLYVIPNIDEAHVGQQDSLWTAPDWRIEMRMADGSEIWMNVSSSISYPQNILLDNTAKYWLNGEGYFQILGTSTKNYEIRTDSLIIRPVSGSELDVRSGLKNGDRAVLLISGEASVGTLYPTGDSTSLIHLNPGQQARLIDGKIIVEQHPNVKGITSWKK